MSVRKEMLETMCLHGYTLYTGQTMRINHEECPAGRDTRRRFYITRKPDVLVGYCHNCQNSVTKYVAPADRYRDDRVHSSTSFRIVEDQYDYPLVLDFYIDEEQLPTEAVVYRLKYQLEKTTCQEYDIKWSPEHFGIVTPVYYSTREAGYQVRPLTTKGGKYFTCMEQDVVMGGFKRTAITDQPVVITEDYISAVRVASLGYLAQCNYGVQVKPEFLHRMVDEFDTVRPYIVWLDNDSKHVCNKAQEIANILAMFGVKNVTVHKDTTEPKHMLDKDIVKVVNSYG